MIMYSDHSFCKISLVEHCNTKIKKDIELKVMISYNYLVMGGLVGTFSK